MSALIRQSHADNDKPLWLSVNGGTATNLTVDTLTVDCANGGSLEIEGNGGVGLRLVSTNSTPNGFIQTDNSIFFSKIGNVPPATSFFTPGGTPNTDVLEVSGTIATKNITTNNVNGYAYPASIVNLIPSYASPVTLNAGVTDVLSAVLFPGVIQNQFYLFSVGLKILPTSSVTIAGNLQMGVRIGGIGSQITWFQNLALPVTAGMPPEGFYLQLTGITQATNNIGVLDILAFNATAAPMTLDLDTNGAPYTIKQIT